MRQAFLFPGQGVQYVGMIKDYYSKYPSVFYPLFNEASHVLDFDIQEYMFKGPKNILNQTEITQPAIVIASIGISMLLTESNIVPDVVAGHSVGQFSALVMANSLTFKDAIRMAHFRGKCMSSTEKEGAMIAIYSKNQKLINNIIKLGLESHIDVAAYNSPYHIVMTGETAKLKSFELILAETNGVITKPLAVSQAFHSRLMESAAQKFIGKIDLKRIKKPTIPVVLNGNSQVSTSVTEIIEDIKLQFTQPVQWSNSIIRLGEEGVNNFIEVGPGTVISKLMRHFDINCSVSSTNTVSCFQRLIKSHHSKGISGINDNGFLEV